MDRGVCRWTAASCVFSWTARDGSARRLREPELHLAVRDARLVKLVAECGETKTRVELDCVRLRVQPNHAAALLLRNIQ